MKTLVVLFFGILCWTHSALAFAAEVSFFTKRGEPFLVVLDGRLINRSSTDRLRLRDIPAGYHMAEIRFPDRFGALVHRTRIFVAPGYNTEYMVQLAGRRPKVIVNKVAQYPLRSNRPIPPRRQERYPDRDRYEVREKDERYPDYRDNDNWSTDDYNPNQDYREDSPAVMRPSEVDRLITSLRERPFDDDKLPLVRQVLGNSTFYAEDLKRVLSLFTYDSKKLELAKSLYRNVYDPRNFYVVYEVFRFDADRRELENYINNLPR